jgi:hypothetical protein
VVFYVSLENAVITVHVGGKQKEKFMINLPNIRNLKGFLKGEWDLQLFDKCFPKKNRLADLDGSIELNGHTLHVEFKASRYANTEGQKLKAYRQAVNSNVTTIFVFGDTNNPVGYLKVSPQNPAEPEYKECGLDGIIEVFSEWSKYTAENNLVKDKTAEWNLIRSW